MDLSKFIDEILIVIVLFQKTPEESSAYTSLHASRNILPSLPTIFIYDNSPDPASVSSDPHFIYRHDPENSGVSKAYNVAVQMATAHNKKWLFLLDQDTRVTPGIYQLFMDAVVTHPQTVAFVPRMQDGFGMVSPFRFSRGRGKRIEVVKTERLPLATYRFINSGLMIRCTAFIQAGGYEENTPLDFSDIAFGEKLQAVTDHFVVVNATFGHSFSGTTSLPLHEVAARFHFFCRGAFYMGKKSGSVSLYFVRAFFRASRLCVKFRSLKFIRILYQHTVHG